MKTFIITIIAAGLIAATIQSFAQSPSPAPTATAVPFDALGLSATPTPTSSATPAPTPDTAHAAHAQVQFHNQSVVSMKADNAALKTMYLAQLARFASDDPAKVAVPLTAAQKVAAMNSAELTEILTIAWELYDILAPLNPGLAQPAIARP